MSPRVQSWLLQAPFPLSSEQALSWTLNTLILELTYVFLHLVLDLLSEFKLLYLLGFLLLSDLVVFPLDSIVVRMYLIVVNLVFDLELSFIPAQCLI